MSDPIPEHPAPCGFPSVQPCICPTPHEPGQDVCAAKIGQPDEANGMDICGEDVFYLTREEAQERGRGAYSGWYHVDFFDGASHGAVPKRAFGL